MGSSQSECDTVAGRQCMASCFFLMQQYDEAASYLGSIASYFDGNPLFHWNYGMALVAAAEVVVMVLVWARVRSCGLVF